MNNTLEAWLKDNMPEAWFAGYDVADSALIALNEYRQAMDRLRAQVAERDATILSLRALRADRDAFIAQVTKILGGYPDSDLLSLATTVAIGYQQWSDGHDAQVEALRAQVATLKERLDRCTCTDDYGDIAE